MDSNGALVQFLPLVQGKRSLSPLSMDLAPVNPMRIQTNVEALHVHAK